MGKLKSINSRVPDLTIKLWFVEYGYQIDILDGEKRLATHCRDFMDDHSIEELKNRSVSALLQHLQNI
jgi:hypothetical protein